MKPHATIAVTVGLLALDRALKLIAQYGLVEGWSFFDFYPRLTLHHNYGLAFDLPIARIAIITVTVIVLVVLMVWLVRIWRAQPRTRSALLFMMIGAASNLFDRVVYGFVIDTIEVLSRSIWNIADIMIVVGLLMLMRSYGQSNIRGTVRT